MSGKMNGLPYYKAYPRDFIEGTIGMSFELKGAYRLILDLIYMQGGRLPDDAKYVSGVLGCSARKWNALRNELIALGKIVVSAGHINSETVTAWIVQARKDDARPSIPASVRSAVLSEGACAYCGSDAGPFEIDHIYPWSRGGTNDRENLILSCRPCNRSKGAKLPEEWAQ